MTYSHAWKGGDYGPELQKEHKILQKRALVE